VTAFALTGEQHALARRVRTIAGQELRPLAAAGAPGPVNRELIKALGQLGLLSRLFPGFAEGGSSREAAATDLCILRESLGCGARGRADGVRRAAGVVPLRYRRWHTPGGTQGTGRSLSMGRN
jgi:hypothetical protein